MQINGNKSVPSTGGTFTGALGIGGAANIDLGAGWLSGTTVYGDAATQNTLTLLDTAQAGAGIGPGLSFGGHTGASYAELGSIWVTKTAAGAGDNQSKITIAYHPTNGTDASWILDNNGFYPFTDATYDLGTASKQFRTAYVGTSVVVGASGTTIGTAGVSKYNNISTAGSGVGPIYGSVALANQSASIGTTNLYAAAPAGLYRICWRQKITTPAGTSSSLLVTIGWNDGAARTTTVWVDTVTGTTGTTADATNTSTGARGNCLTIYSAAGQNITYATTYASNAAGAMKYSLDMTVEKLN